MGIMGRETYIYQIECGSISFVSNSPPLSFVLGANKTGQRVRAYVKRRNDVNPIVDERVS